MKLQWAHIKELSDRLLEDPSGSKASWFWERLVGYDSFQKEALWELAEDAAYYKHNGRLIRKYRAREIR